MAAGGTSFLVAHVDDGMDRSRERRGREKREAREERREVEAAGWWCCKGSEQERRRSDKSASSCLLLPSNRQARPVEYREVPSWAREQETGLGPGRHDDPSQQSLSQSINQRCSRHPAKCQTRPPEPSAVASL